MKKFNKNFSLVVLLAVAITLGLSGPSIVQAATSPTLVGSAAYSVLGSSTVTNTGATTTVGEVGVAVPGTAITGFPPGFAAGNNDIHLHSNDASAIAAQADNLTAFGALNTGANASGNCLNPLTGIAGTAPDATDLVGLSLAPGLYCSAGSFLLTNGAGTDLTLTGAGPWVFKTVSGLTISSGSSASVTTGSACDVWWRVGSSATIGTTSDFKGNILALTSISLATGATLAGRAMAQTGAVTLAGNTISGCAAPLVGPSLTLDKIEVGGADAESAWTLTASGPTPISGPGAVGSTDVVSGSSFLPGTYTLSESTGPARHTASLWSCVKNSGTAVLNNSIVLDWGDTATCTITNTYNPPTSGNSSFMQPAVAPVFSPSINIISTPIVPKLPKTGYPPQQKNTMIPIVILSGLSLFSIFLYFARKKQTT